MKIFSSFFIPSDRLVKEGLSRAGANARRFSEEHDDAVEESKKAGEKAAHMTRSNQINRSVPWLAGKTPGIGDVKREEIVAVSQAATVIAQEKPSRARARR